MLFPLPRMQKHTALPPNARDKEKLQAMSNYLQDYLHMRDEIEAILPAGDVCLPKQKHTGYVDIG